MLDRGNATLHSPHTIEVLVQFVLVVMRESAAQIFGAIEYQIKHLSIERIHFLNLSRLVGLSEKPVEHAARIRLGGHWLCRRSEAAVRIVTLV